MPLQSAESPATVAAGLRRVLIALNAKVAGDLLFLRAGGLTYTTILSFVPFLAVTFSVLKAFGVQNQIEPALVKALEPLGSQGVDIAHQAVEFVDNLEVGMLGAVGVVGLLYTAVSVVGQIEDSLNQIWHVRKSRSLIEQCRDYLSLVLVGPVIVFAVVALVAAAQASWLVQRLLAIEGLGWVGVGIAQLTPMLFLLAGFTVAYKVLPCTRVNFRAALVGGVTSAVLWQFASSLFAAFVTGSTHYTAIYSGFAILILSLMWVYICWLIALVGGEVAYLCQHPAMALASKPGEHHRLTEVASLRALIEVARRHMAGEPPCELEALALQVQATPEMLEEFVDECVRRGILLSSSEPDGIALGRAPESISTAEVFEILRAGAPTDGSAPSGDAVTMLLGERDRVVSHAFQGTTLGSLLERSRPESSETSPA
jgi:membrane protein